MIGEQGSPAPQHGSSQSRLEAKIADELLAARKTGGGLTVATLATDCPVLSAVMGDGDPLVAYNAVKHRLLDADADTSLTAAMYSLGFASVGKTHLARLEDFGAEHGYDQRQARRYSDRGVRQLARLLATNWVNVTSPQLTATIVQTGESDFDCFTRTQHQLFVQMRPVSATLRGTDGTPNRLELASTGTEEGLWLVRRYKGPVQLRVAGEASLTLVWQGEQWPKYNLQILGDLSGHAIISEMLGAKLMIRIITI